MGATKVNTKKLSGINVSELGVESFRLLKNEICRFVVDADVDAGDMLLLKASFKNPCETESHDEDDSKPTYRRRIVPFVAHARKIACNDSGRRTVTAAIDNITPGDKKFFYKKFFATKREDRSTLDIEGRKIVFLS